jgi:signal peptide peptidase SppA
MTIKPEERTAQRIPLDEVMALDPRAVTRAFMPMFDDGEDRPKSYDTVKGVAVVSIDGPLTQRQGWWFDSYDAVERRFAMALTDPDVTAVVLRINSPGGTCAGCFETARRMQQMKVAAGKPVVSYADEAAYSAAYALACVGEQITLPESGGVGSVGVIAAFVDETKMNEKFGIKVAVVTSGDQKADGHPDVPLTQEALDRLQARVDQLANIFATIVGDARRMTPAAVRGLEAGCFYGSDAVSSGLADRVGTLADAISSAAQLARSQMSRTQSRTAAPLGANTMLSVLTILGLAATATEDEARAAVQQLQSRDASLRSLTALAGKNDPGEALGVFKAWKEDAATSAADRAELAGLKLATAKNDHEVLLAKGIEDGKIPPADAEFWGSQPLATLRGYLAGKAPVVKRETEVKNAKIGATEPLTDREKQIAASAGISDAEFAAEKAKRQSRS